jgi:branched-subunit amino acid aminotransferase/4-amino-4-deoxychorismate lyase
MELLETMRVEAGGAIPLLPRHLERLGRSARFFGFLYDSDGIPAAILDAASRQTEPVVLRLVLSREGDFQIQQKPLPEPGMPSRLVLAKLRVNSADPLLRHKTTARSVYDRARNGHDPSADVILVNERGEVTETTIANIAVLRNGRWLTPPLSSGVLPGTMRAQLLDEAKIVEAVFHADDLVPGEPIRYFNAVRGVFDISFG